MISLDKIKSDLKGLYSETKAEEMSENDFADKMAVIIQDAILSATVKTQNLPVTGGYAIISDTILQ